MKSHIFIRKSFKTYGISGPQISIGWWWLGQWSKHFVMVGWSMEGGWWSVVGGRLISAFKETL